MAQSKVIQQVEESGGEVLCVEDNQNGPPGWQSRKYFCGGANCRKEIISMTSRVDSSIWWLHPACVVGTSGLLIGAAAYAIPESIYRNHWRTPKFFELSALEVTLACVAVFVFGAVLSQTFMSRTRPRVRVHGRMKRCHGACSHSCFK